MITAFDDLFMFVAHSPKGEAVVLIPTEMGSHTPLVYPSKEVIPQVTYDYVKDVANNHKIHIELKQYKYVQSVDQFIPENVLTM